MTHHVFAAALLATVASSAAFAQATPAAPAPAAATAPAAGNSGKTLTPPQAKMKDCSQQAKAKGLKGDARKAFMSDCLKK